MARALGPGARRDKRLEDARRSLAEREELIAKAIAAGVRRCVARNSGNLWLRQVIQTHHAMQRRSAADYGEKGALDEIMRDLEGDKT